MHKIILYSSISCTLAVRFLLVLIHCLKALQQKILNTFNMLYAV